ncbi:MAG TPA: ankyrin repeat domain-containing protein [Gallionella sp.]|nr:ankyrin repeat domain-containing protein [Gallionella sp.]
MKKQTLKDVLKKYSSHPEFLGLDLVDPNQRGAVDDTPLHIASRKGELEDIQVLLDSGADINISGDLGNTPLHQAAMCGKVEVVKKLLSCGANSDLKNEFGQTPLKVAELGKHNKVVELLAKR